jgi:uncharacterized protein HemX
MTEMPQGRSARTASILAAIAIILAIGAGTALWIQNQHDQTTASSSSTLASSKDTAGQGPARTVAQNTASAPIAASDETAKSIEELKQKVQDLDAARQNQAQQLDATKQQLNEAQGDLKLLSQQVGAISARLNDLSNSAAAMPSNGAETKSSKRTKSR